jgi:hypothetical protein
VADYWVRVSGGSDANTGADYDNALATFGQARTLLESSGVKGTRILLVNDGSHVLPTTQLDITNAALLGTSDSDPGFTVEGVDAAGDPALVTCINSGTNVARMFQLRSGVGYVVVRGLKIDLTGVDSGNGSLVMQMRDSDAGPIFFEAGHIKGYADDTIGAAVRTLIDGNTTGPADYGEIRYSVLENCLDPLGLSLGSTTKKVRIHHCVITFTGDWVNTFNGTIQAGTTPVNASDDVGFYSNTVFVNDSGANTISSIFDWGPASGDAGAFNCHSNYIWIETAGAVTQVFAGAAAATATNTGTIGYNTVRFGPSVAAGDNASGLYQDPWDDAVDPKATDSVAYEVAAASVFNDPTQAWTWPNVGGTNYDLPLPRDLRPLLNLTSGLAGITPGALPAPQTDYSVEAATSNTAPAPNDAVDLTVTYTNTGVDAVSCVAAAAVPAGLTLVTATPSQGSYSLGVWTIGDVDSGATATLTLSVTVDADQAGNTIVFTASHTSGDPVTDTDSTNDSSSVSMTVILPPSEDPTETPFLDVAPIFAPVLLAEVNAGLRTTRNRLTHHELRVDVKRHKWHEYTARRITLAAGATLQVISSIERINHAMIEADGTIQVSASNSDTDAYFPDVQRLALLNGNLTTLKLKNLGATAVNVLLVVID